MPYKEEKERGERKTRRERRAAEALTRKKEAESNLPPIDLVGFVLDRLDKIRESREMATEHPGKDSALVRRHDRSEKWEV